jgi:hypothetical protein
MRRILYSLLIAVIATAAGAAAFAADNTQHRAGAMSKWKLAEFNYVNALRTGNEGTKIAAAGYLAEYKLKGGIPELLTVLRTDKCENVRMAAALALVMLDAEEGRTAVEESSLYDGSDRVAKFCETLLQVHAEKGRIIAQE